MSYIKLRNWTFEVGPQTSSAHHAMSQRCYLILAYEAFCGLAPLRILRDGTSRTHLHDVDLDVSNIYSILFRIHLSRRSMLNNPNIRISEMAITWRLWMSLREAAAGNLLSTRDCGKRKTHFGILLLVTLLQPKFFNLFEGPITIKRGLRFS